MNKRMITMCLVCIVMVCFAQSAAAGIAWSGDVDPADPATWTSSTYGFIGKYSYGTMDITSGSDVLAQSGIIGRYSGSTGEVTVDGASSTWTNSSVLYVGSSGSGTLDITGGGRVSNSGAEVGASTGSTGEVTVDGYSSTWTSSGNIFIGESGNGVLNITGDGDVTSNDEGYIGYGSSSTGTVTVDGSGSTWTNSYDLYVGRYGDGTLNITSGGRVSCSFGHGFIGRYPGSTGTVTVDGAGSRWTNNGDLRIGNSGDGAVNITSGGYARNYYFGYVGYDSGSTGEVTVDGASSKWINSVGLDIGYNGSGMLDITNGGEVRSGSTSYNSYIGSYSGSTGEVTVDGASSTWTNNGGLRVGWYGRGMLNITSGGLVSVAKDLVIDNYGVVDSFINMATGGKLAIYGDADDSLASFLGLINGTDAIRYWDDSISDWADIMGATLNVDYTLTYFDSGDLANYTVLTVGVSDPTLLVGDANRDGVVSAGDYSTVQGNFGFIGIPGLLGDANGDGIVSAGDYASVQANFGNIATPLATAPEPVTLSLLVWGGLVFVRRKRNI